MEKDTSTGMSVFQQICEINELDPQAIIQEAQGQSSEKSAEGNNVENLIRVAYEHRVKDLLQKINADTAAKVKADGKVYKIDPDPAAPAFMLHDEYIRSAYSEEEASQIIEALGHVQLPVTG